MMLSEDRRREARGLKELEQRVAES